MSTGHNFHYLFPSRHFKLQPVGQISYLFYPCLRINLIYNIVGALCKTGTGKSTTLVQLILELRDLGRRVHVTAASNDAIRVLACKVLRALRCSDSAVGGDDCGGNSSDSNSSSTPCCLGDILLVGLADRLGIEASDEAAALHLGFREHAVGRAKLEMPKFEATVRRLLGWARDAPHCHSDQLQDDAPYKHTTDSPEQLLDTFITAVNGLYSHVLSLCTQLLQPCDAAFQLLGSVERDMQQVRAIMTSFGEDSRQLLQLFTPPMATSAATGTATVTAAATAAAVPSTAGGSQDRRSALLEGVGAMVDALCSGARKAMSILSSSPELASRKGLLEHASIVLSTVSTGGISLLLSKPFDDCIIDEATQLPESHTALVLKAGLERLVLAGDHQQLPATVISQRAQQAGFGRSLFERLLRTGHYPALLLDVQYRMHPTISAWPNSRFYQGEGILRKSNSLPALLNLIHSKE